MAQEKDRSPFDLRLIAGLAIVALGIFLYVRFVDPTLGLALFLLALLLVSCAVALGVDLYRMPHKPGMGAIFGLYFKYILYTLLQLLITLSTFPLLPLLFVLGPGLLLLMGVSGISCIMLFVVHVIGYTPPGITMEFMDQKALFFIISFFGSIVVAYFAYGFKGGFVTWISEHYVDSVVALLRRLNPGPAPDSEDSPPPE